MCTGASSERSRQLHPEQPERQTGVACDPPSEGQLCVHTGAGWVGSWESSSTHSPLVSVRGGARKSPSATTRLPRTVSDCDSRGSRVLRKGCSHSSVAPPRLLTGDGHSAGGPGQRPQDPGTLLLWSSCRNCTPKSAREGTANTCCALE